MGKKKNNHNTNNHKANNKVSNKIETKTENTQDTNLDEIDKMMEAELESAATAEEQSDIVKDESIITEEQPSVEDDTEIEMEIIEVEKPKKKKFYSIPYTTFQSSRYKHTNLELRQENYECCPMI